MLALTDSCLYLWKEQEFKIVEEVWPPLKWKIKWVILLQLFRIPAPFWDIGRCLSKPAHFFWLTLQFNHFLIDWMSRSFNVLKILWQSKPQVWRPSLKLVSGPIIAKHRSYWALIGPETKIKEGLWTWGLLCRTYKKMIELYAFLKIHPTYYIYHYY